MGTVMQRFINYKPLKGYEELYLINEYGEVASIKHQKHLKSHDDGYGYLQISLSKCGERKTYKVHQLVAINYLGHKPCGHSIVVDHLDLNRYNNHKSNLRLVTNRVNSNKKHLFSSSKHVGVSWSKSKNKWKAYYFNKKYIHIGYYDTEDSAKGGLDNFISNIITLKQ